MRIVSSSRMREIDEITIDQYGIPAAVLMENAGIEVLNRSLELCGFGAGDRIVCAAGGGNNGGDALVIARQLQRRGFSRVTVVSAAGAESELRRIHYGACERLGIETAAFPSETAAARIAEAAVIFDGLAGTGIRGGLRGDLPGLVALINASNAVRIAIDAPSGISESFRPGWSAVAADHTVSIGLPLRALYMPAARPLCGNISNVEIGFPAGLREADAEADGIHPQLTDESLIDSLMPDLPLDSFKNRRGHLAVIGGSRGTYGAASLCAAAASRSPAGLVSLISDRDSFPHYSALHRSEMVEPAPPLRELADRLAAFSAIAVGPGWGTEGRAEQLRIILENGRGVLDADGINCLALAGSGRKTLPLGGRWLLTPHPGEFARLFPDLDCRNEPYAALRTAAERLDAVVLLKGHVSFIAAPDGRFSVVDGAFPKLGVAGSGDVLAGYAAGLVCCGMDIFDAARLAALVHLRAAKRAAGIRDWFSSGDLIDCL